MYSSSSSSSIMGLMLHEDRDTCFGLLVISTIHSSRSQPANALIDYTPSLFSLSTMTRATASQYFLSLSSVSQTLSLSPNNLAPQKTFSLSNSLALNHSNKTTFPFIFQLLLLPHHVLLLLYAMLANSYNL